MTPGPDRFADATLFKALFETAPDAMVVVDRTGIIVLANPRAESLFGYAPGMLAGQMIEVLLPDQLRALHVAHRTNYMDSPRVRPMGAGYELTGVRADGSPFPVEIGLSPIAAKPGSLFAASIRDISETQRARQALARSRYDAALADISRRILVAPSHETALAEVPALIASALSAPAVAILLTDPHRDKPRITASWGLDPAFRDRLSQATWLPMLDPRSRERMNAGEVVAFPVLDASPSTHAVVTTLPDRRTPAGYVVAWLPPGNGSDRDRHHFVGAVANVLSGAIQRGRADEQLAHAQRLDALGQLTGGIAHDFNNLLTIISGNLQLLEMAGPKDAATVEMVASASRAVERGSALTRKLLGFSRRQRLTPRAVRPELLLADLSDMLARTLGEQIQVMASCGDALPAVFADPGELEAALINLALNARDAMPDGGKLIISARALEIQVDEEVQPGSYVAFSVVDSGVGMLPEVSAHAFEPFFTTKDPGKGSGLGLSMVYGFVKQSGGRLILESEAGVGTRIEMVLPVAQEPAMTAPAPAHVAVGGASVLVVEDEAEVRRIAASFLRTAGYVPVEAADAAAAREAFDSHPEIEMLFTDVVLGSGDSGIELARQLQELRPTLKVLLTSGYEYGSRGDEPADDPIFPLLRKPYRRDELIAAWHRVLART
ncbi:PAS domain-containing hybrid sensor histidine kinase/response regulator [Luteibacter yeojuensis]|uniref:histidine kinase n=1 Tax=Luteibacter yeojuensis TaxID=345309 RepID=A0A7X5TNK8_9GAMM|nr:PAS domain-containing hybrid sensor histidine kinase/response regulator [Luteibacter yeojuensis]NID14611.1 PAS domain S-box protein [Luteibacter yeojuensis]